MDKRTVTGLIVCFIALFLYFNVILPAFQPPPPPAPVPQPEAAPEPPRHPAGGTSEPAFRATSAPAAATTQPAGAPTALTDLPEQTVQDDIECETDLFRVVLTNRGAAIRSLVLRDFYTVPRSDPKPGGGDLRLVSEIQRNRLSLTVAEAGRADGIPLDTVVWQHVPDCPVPEGFCGAERFRTVLPRRGLEIVKTFLFRQPGHEVNGGRAVGGRDILVEISIHNRGEQPVPFRWRLRSAAGIVPEAEVPPSEDLEHRQSRDVAALVGSRAGEKIGLETYGVGKVKDGPYRRADATGEAIYAGVKNRYFVAVLKPVSKGTRIAAVRMEQIGEHNITADIELPPDRIPAGGASTHRFMFFVAPRMPEMLRDYAEQHFEELLPHPWPAPVTRVLSWLLQTFRSIAPNYGWAIVLLTICVRALLHPLTHKSQKSTHKMQRIQPLISAAKAKYKHDKRQQQQEVMKIMREQGANPLGGCLPMLLQLPIFIGLWRMLYQDASLRHAPFLLWINDLSKADNLFSLDSAFPLIGRSFNLLPILCAAAMAYHQKKMTVKSTDPQQQQQQKIMMFMPILFAVMLYHMPSGLMVYFLVSTTFGMVEQHFIRKRLDAAAAATEEATAPVPVEPKRQKPAPQRRKKRRRR